MWRFKQTTQFKKDFKKCSRNREKMASFLEVLEQLRESGTVDVKHSPHILKGNYFGYMECHIGNDFLLIWLDETEHIVRLVRLGSHSELFK